MKNEMDAIREMKDIPGLRDDLFTMKRVSEATGLSRTMLIKLEKEGFLTPSKTDEETGWRYYDTFNIFKLLQYKRLRMIGMKQKEIFEYYTSGTDSLSDVLQRMKQQRQILEQNIETLSLRLDREKNYSFSFYDFNEMMCLAVEAEKRDLVEANVLGYNLSVETIASGFRPLETEELFAERSDFMQSGISQPELPWRTKIYQPIDPLSLKDDSVRKPELAPARHTFSILVYGIYSAKELVKPKNLLLDEIKVRGLEPTGDPVRIQWIAAKYTGMHLEENEYVVRIAVPVKS